MINHSELPWQVTLPKNGHLMVRSCNNLIMADCGANTDANEANAAFIVRACNNHEILLGVCKKVLQNIKAGNPKLGTAFVTDLLEQAIQSAEEL
jgi:hypothetical protein